MKNPFLLACLFLFFSINVSAQGKIPEFGKIDIAELNLKECGFENTAGAMILAKTARIEFEVNGFTNVPILTIEYNVRIKIFNKRGYPAASIKIPYVSNSRSTKIKDVEGYIYSLDPNGKIIKEKVEKKEIFNERSKDKKSLNYLAFTFPDLKDGSVIEYKYSKVDKNSLGVQPWFFQDEIPTSFSRITTVVPGFAKMSYHVLASDPLERDSSYKKRFNPLFNETSYSFTMRNIHSFRIEPLMSSLKDNLQRVEFTLSPANIWETIFFSNDDVKWRLLNFFLLRARFFGGQFEKDIPGTSRFIDSVKKLARMDDKIATVYNYVKKNVEWNGEQTFYCDSVESCWKNKSGSSAEMNILLLNLLRKAGVTCYPALVSTHENGHTDPDFPSLSQFNGVDVLARDSPAVYSLDCTQKQLSFKLPPYNVLNSYAYIVDNQLYSWVFLTKLQILLKNDALVTAVMDSSGNIRGSANLSSFGFAKTAALTEMKQKEEKTTGNDLDLSDNAQNLVVDTAIMEPVTDENDTLIQRLQFHFNPPNTGAFYFINPFMFSGFKKNPFKDSTRFTDVDFGSNQSFLIRVRIQIPDNFSTETMPKNITILLQDSAILFERKIHMDGSCLVIYNSFILKNAIFVKEEYQDLKSFFDKFYGLLNEEIVLKKKS